MFSLIRPRQCVENVIGSAILAFGLYQVHSFAGVTEGGVLGLTLLLHHWLHLSPAVSGLVLNIACYGLGWRLLGILPRGELDRISQEELDAHYPGEGQS